MKVKVAQLCLTLCNSKDYTVHGILQARILESVAIPFSKGSSQPKHPALQADSLPAKPHGTGSPRILERIADSGYLFSSGSSIPRNWTGVSSIAGRFFTNWAMREPWCTVITNTSVICNSPKLETMQMSFNESTVRYTVAHSHHSAIQGKEWITDNFDESPENYIEKAYKSYSKSLHFIWFHL